MSDSANQRARAGVGSVRGLLYAFNHERAGLTLMLRGVSGEMLTPLDIEGATSPASGRASQITGMLPMFVMMAVLYGALTAALDSTAGERERGSLEPLLMNPCRTALVLGKWGAVALLGLGWRRSRAWASFRAVADPLRQSAGHVPVRLVGGAGLLAAADPDGCRHLGRADGLCHPQQDLQGSPGRQLRRDDGRQPHAPGHHHEPGREAPGTTGFPASGRTR